MKQKYALIIENCEEEFGGGFQFCMIENADSRTKGKYVSKNFDKVEKMRKKMQADFPRYHYKTIIVIGDI